MSERTYILRAVEIHRLRTERGLTVRELAKRAEVDVKTLQRWLKGKPAFLAGAHAVARALDTNLQNLLDGFQPTYAGVTATPEAVFRMTFSVELDQAPTPEQIKELCDLLDQAVIAFRERPRNSPNARIHYLGEQVQLSEVRPGPPRMDGTALPAEVESHPTEPMPNRMGPRRFVGSIEDSGYVLYYVSRDPCIESLNDMLSWSVIVEVAAGATDEAKIAGLKRVYCSD